MEVIVHGVMTLLQKQRFFLEPFVAFVDDMEHFHHFIQLQKEERFSIKSIKNHQKKKIPEIRHKFD